MAAIEWDKIGKRFFETGVDRGVLYILNEEDKYSNGVAWNGLITVTEKPSGAEQTPQFADNMKYLTITSPEEFGITIEAFSYPEEFESCDGTASPVKGVRIGQQIRHKFGFVYRTIIGNDTKNTDLGYKLHLIYNCIATPSERSYKTVNESPEAITFSWEANTTPIAIKGFKPSASVILDSIGTPPDKLKLIEDKLYGTESTNPTLPMPDEILAILKSTESGV